MARITPIADHDADERVRAVYGRARATYGWLPNTIRVMARGSATAELYLEAGRLNSQGSLSATERELLAILTAARNQCDYCLTAHSLAARALSVPFDDVEAAALRAESADPRVRAILQFACAVLDAAGRVADADLADAYAAGLESVTLLDIVCTVIENSLGNLINNLADTQLDPVLRRSAERTVRS